MNDDFVDLLSALIEADVRFLVVGAHALAVHGVPRATGDLDVWILNEPENAGRVWKALGGFGAPIEALGLTVADLEQDDRVVQIGSCDPLKDNLILRENGEPRYLGAPV